MTDAEIAAIAEGLIDFEREFITGWQGVGGAAYNVVATGLVRKGLLIGPLDWNLNQKGERVREYLENRDG